MHGIETEEEKLLDRNSNGINTNYLLIILMMPFQQNSSFCVQYMVSVVEKNLCIFFAILSILRLRFN